MLTKEQVELRKEFEIRSDRVDDIVLFIGMISRKSLPQALDKDIPGHWKQREFSLI